MADYELLIVNLEGYGKGGLGTLAYHLHGLLLGEDIPSALIASGNPANLPHVFVLEENDYDPVPQLVRSLSARHSLVLGRNELATLSDHLSDLILMTGGTAYLQDWLEAHPQKTTQDFLRSKHRSEPVSSSRIARERRALKKAVKILSAPGLNSWILKKAYPEFVHKIFEVPQIFRAFQSQRSWDSREIDLIAVAQWKDRGIDRGVKGYRLLAETLTLLEGKDLRTVVVGEVPFEIKGVTHTGWQDHEEVIRLVGNAKVSVSPSRNECYSQAIVEALQLGCNVVLSRNVEPHGFCHESLIARYDAGSFCQKIGKALQKRFPIKPMPSPKDALHLLMAALQA
jgi:glycosyltransferase involved in cell wall biosynthesis